MTFDQLAIISIFTLSLILFVWGRPRYDMVAIIALLLAVIIGIVPSDKAFSSFGHPAVITVVAVLIITKSIERSGAVDLITHHLYAIRHRPTLITLIMIFMVAILSAFMNNVGALALLLPVAMQQSADSNRSPSEILMPMSFASLLGGLTTLIGTPPNIYIAAYRADVMGESYKMFDFFPAGFLIAFVCLLFLGLVGWRLLPPRVKPGGHDEAMFDLENYFTEATITQTSDYVDRPLSELESITNGDATIVGLFRKDRKILAPSGYFVLKDGDILIIEGDPSALAKITEAAGLKQAADNKFNPEHIKSDEFEMVEVIVSPGSRLEGSTARQLRLRSRYRLNILAISRKGQSILERLKSIRFNAGDILLIQADKSMMKDAFSTLGCLPLASRNISMTPPKINILPIAIFIGAIMLTAFGVVYTHIAFMSAALLIVLTSSLPLRDAYDSIEWPVIVLLGAMIPVGNALETTGVATMIANSFVEIQGSYSPLMLLTFLMAVTIFMTEIITNMVCVVIMAPIAYGIAVSMGVSPDPFFMTVVIGSCCAFLTPIGHKSNLLVMGPGGYKFTDYTRLGAPVTLLALLAGPFIILQVWPL